MATQGMTSPGPEETDESLMDQVLVVHQVVQPGINQQLTEVATVSGPIKVTEHSSPGSGEPPAKRHCPDGDANVNTDQSVKQILFNINKAICLRLDAIENKIEQVCARTKVLEERMNTVAHQVRAQTNVIVTPSDKKRPDGDQKPKISPFVVGLPTERTDGEGNLVSSEGSQNGGVHNLGPNITLITLNNEEDYPMGSWLGEETNPEMRVRVPITPSDMLHVHSNCRTPEKMALTLLDYLFDRDTQATSNLSGMGKHGKKQLDPLMIYGIRCHLIHKFNITEHDWHRIKQNIDSKCRTAFRRKQRGLPLTVKAFRGKAPPTYIQLQDGGVGLINHDLDNSDNSLSDSSEIHVQQGDVDMHPNIIQTHGGPDISQLGEIQVLHATPEQIAQLQQGQHIQILQGDASTQIIQLTNAPGQPVQTLQQISGHQDVHVTEITSGSPTTSTPAGMQVIKSENGDGLDISCHSVVDDSLNQGQAVKLAAEHRKFQLTSTPGQPVQTLQMSGHPDVHVTEIASITPATSTPAGMRVLKNDHRGLDISCHSVVSVDDSLNQGQAVKLATEHRKFQLTNSHGQPVQSLQQISGHADVHVTEITSCSPTTSTPAGIQLTTTTGQPVQTLHQISGHPDVHVTEITSCSPTTSTPAGMRVLKNDNGALDIGCHSVVTVDDSLNQDQDSGQDSDV